MPETKHHMPYIRQTQGVNIIKCQANIGTKQAPRSCGENLKKVNDWTFICRKHGEMH